MTKEEFIQDRITRAEDNITSAKRELATSTNHPNIQKRCYRLIENSRAKILRLNAGILNEDESYTLEISK